MKIDVVARPSYAMAVIDLDATEAVAVEAGSMVAMRGVEVQTRLATGFFFALARRVFGGESMFLNTYTAGDTGGQVYVAPGLVGDIIHRKMDGGTIYVQAGSFLASSPEIELKLKWAGLRMLFGSEGAFFLRCTGVGDLLFNAYGGIEEVPIDGKYTVDTGHIVAYEGDLTSKLRGVGGISSTLFSGEGLVMDLEGQGKVWIQTRSLGALVSWLTPMLPG
jgi:uncharacterized protein (TIGR00266 family)